MKNNTRFAGRYNTPGQFVPAAEPLAGAARAAGGGRPAHDKLSDSTFGPRKQQQQQNLQPVQVSQMTNNQPQPQNKNEEVKMDTDNTAMAKDNEDSGPVRPHWMKSKLPGVKKVSNKERRRRQNENLRRLLTPKNALMVLNEMMPNEQVANQFKVEPSATNQYYKTPNAHNFCADLTIDGNNYKGYGDNKLMARNAAAEQAIRDLIIKKMNKVINSDGGQSLNASEAGSASGECDDEALPMIQLASFALHKLFTEWEYEGHKVPQLKPSALSTSESVEPAGKKAKELPLNAAHMHPCMLLTYMRPHLEYRELAADGDRPQNMLFTMGVDVDNATYIGKASNKKEARKLAAKAACQALFNVQFAPNAAANTPLPAQ
ncbi:double-stranded RNA-specific editase 1-like isoform X2 [Helicoverpa zea]|uniref:double-stranded RNA-specific editase 1-like isoform X2 n=1 Tax=Helicoverpa zea TaxID=7113 RepID=UPI001F5A756F|nr:double-stranded RNA-specific editase 1-like isoform X2 [Helicoverpa zea]